MPVSPRSPSRGARSITDEREWRDCLKALGRGFALHHLNAIHVQVLKIIPQPVQCAHDGTHKGTAAFLSCASRFRVKLEKNRRRSCPRRDACVGTRRMVYSTLITKRDVDEYEASEAVKRQ